MRFSAILRAAAVLTAMGCRLAAFAGEPIHGAGATFPAPVYAAWAAKYAQSSGIKVTYDALGSGAGTDLPGAQCWPITGASFILIGTSAASSVKTRAALQFFYWSLHQGEPLERTLDYVPVPGAVVAQLPLLWETLRDSSGKPLWP
jgi:ABC-type phosphate transport system substrate-binding protein